MFHLIIKAFTRNYASRGLAVGDRVRIVHALHAVGLDADARAFALEGLMALK